MAIVRRNLKEARQGAASQVDFAKLDATTEEDIRRQMIEDGEDPDAPLAEPALVNLRGAAAPANVRRRTGLSQEAFAAALRVPVNTLRNWEQGRTVPDPSARSLLALIASDPEKHIEDLRPQMDEGAAKAHTQENRMLTQDDLDFIRRMQQERGMPSQGEAARIRDIERKLRALRLDGVLASASR